MDPGTPLAVATLCYETGNLLIQAIHNWNNADKEIAERVTIVENCWIQTRLQVEFISGILQTLDSEHERILEEMLVTLTCKMSLVSSRLERLVDKDSSKRLGFLALASKAKRGRYVLRKEALDAAIKEMEEWQRRFNPSWFLLMKKDSPVIDEELKRTQAKNPVIHHSSQPSIHHSSHPSMLLTVANGVRDAQRAKPQHPVPIFLPFEELETFDIVLSNARLGHRHKNNRKRFVIDTLACAPGRSVDGLMQDVVKLAGKLARADPLTFGLFTCRGVMRVVDPTQNTISAFDFVFRVPDGIETLKSLRHVLLTAEYSLTRRVAIAKDLARSVTYVHTLSFVHKNIRPESILISETSSSHKATFLVGFNSFRDDAGATALVGDIAWDKNLYRHPSRQGEFPEQRYNMQHDIYSLGVCLLEIGLWTSFLTYTDDVPPQPQHAELKAMHEKWLDQSDDKDFNDKVVESTDPGLTMFGVKDYFVHLAQSSLPNRLGDRYTKVVISCLTCLDERDENFRDIANDKASSDGVLMGVRFIEQVLFELEEIII